MLRVYLFGAPRVDRDGQPAGTDRRKALALLAYLALEGGRPAREKLAALLWPDYDQSRAFAYLRRTLWELNQLLGEGQVQADRDGVALAQSLWIDVNEFRALIAAGRRPGAEPELLARAVALYRDHFLAGFNLKDASDFDEWALYQAEGLKRDLAGALETLSRGQADAPPDQALEFGRRWLALDPLNEAAQRALMEAYARAGQASAALRQYEEGARLLKAELGVAPAQDTTALAEAIRAGRLAPRAAQPETPAAPPSRLPRPATPFIGRSRELEQITAWLAEPECRLLNIVGPGGVGKTRLALRATEAQAGRFAQGVFFVPLAAVEAAAGVVPAIAEAVGFSFFGQSPRREELDQHQQQRQLLNFLSGKQMLLALDNFEHLAAAAGLLSEILQAAPQVKVLATSRERFNLQEEWVLPLQGMRYPGPADLAQAAEFSAVRLFEQAARKARLDFTLAADDLPAVIRICELVEGFPLGLELAAAWVKTLSCREITREIERSLDFLASPLRNTAQRHQSLRAIFESSWTLLEPAEQAVYPSLTVFVGAFTRAAAEAVADAPLARLSALVDKSLLYHRPDGRYDLHQALRQYAGEKLAEQPEQRAALLARHSAFYGEFMHAREAALRQHGQKQALAEIAAEFENVRAGFHWAITHGLAGDVGRYLGALAGFLDTRSRFEEAAQLCDTILAAWQARGRPELADQLILARLRAWSGWFHYRQSRVLLAEERMREALDLLASLPDDEAVAGVRAYVNLQAVLTGIFPGRAEAEPLIRDSFEYYRAHHDAWGNATVFPYTAIDEGFAALRAAYLTSIEMFRALGDDRGACTRLAELGETVHHAGFFAEARQYFEESLALARALEDRYWVSLTLDWSGWVARQMGLFDEARAQHTQSLALSREIGDQLGVAGSLDNLGLLAFELGDLAEARRQFEAGLALRQSTGHPWSVAVSFEHLGRLALSLGEVDHAEAHVQEALAINPQYWEAQLRLGEVRLAQGRRREAQDLMRPVLRQALHHNNLWIALGALTGLAPALDPADAVTALTLVQQHAASDHATRQRAAALLPHLIAALSPAARAAAEARGRTLSLEALAAALAEAASAPQPEGAPHG
ncbi:MAG: tetratricopeptide repeat protein [Anaerolineales bacterium]|nr:tetratricopeptide repeat protein [Anaerolineales bacterium]